MFNINATDKINYVWIYTIESSSIWKALRGRSIIRVLLFPYLFQRTHIADAPINVALQSAQTTLLVLSDQCSG